MSRLFRSALLSARFCIIEVSLFVVLRILVDQLWVGPELASSAINSLYYVLHRIVFGQLVFEFLLLFVAYQLWKETRLLVILAIVAVSVIASEAILGRGMLDAFNEFGIYPEKRVIGQGVLIVLSSIGAWWICRHLGTPREDNLPRI